MFFFPFCLDELESMINTYQLDKKFCKDVRIAPNKDMFKFQVIKIKIGWFKIQNI